MFLVPAGLSDNFRRLSVHPWDLQATHSATVGHSQNCFNSPCGHGTFLQFSVRSRDLSATFLAATGLQLTSINFPCIHETFRQHSSILRAAAEPYVNFCHFFVQPRDHPEMSVNFLCDRGTFLQLLSNFSAPARSFVYLCQLSVCLQDLPSGYRQLSVLPCFHAFCQLTSTLRVSTGPSVNFPCIRGTIHQIFVCQRNILSTSVTISCGRRTFCQLVSTFCVAAKPSINFCQLSMHPRDLQSTCVNFSCISGTFSQLSVHPWDFPSASVNSQCIRQTMRQIFMHQ